MNATKKQSLAIFASDQGPGDPERGSIMAQAGAFLATRNVRIFCFAQNGNLCVPLISSIRTAGGDITILADGKFNAPSGLADIAVEQFEDEPNKKYQRIGELTDAFIGLPGSLLSAKTLFETWVATGRSKPVALLNKNRNFEFMRGFATDIVSSKVKKIEHHIVLSDNIEDLWNRLSRSFI